MVKPVFFHRVSKTTARTALAALCEIYWPPVYVYLRRRGNDPHRAEDLTQGFFLSFIDKGYLQSVSEDKGKFRAFILASVKNYVANVHDRERAQKRGGDVVAVPLDAKLAELMAKIEKSLIFRSRVAAIGKQGGLATLEEAQVHFYRSNK